MHDSRFSVSSAARWTAPLLCGACTWTSQPFDAPEPYSASEDELSSDSAEAQAPGALGAPGFSNAAPSSPAPSASRQSLSDSENYVGDPSLQQPCSQPPCSGESLQARGGAMVNAAQSQGDAGPRVESAAADSGVLEYPPDAGTVQSDESAAISDAGGDGSGSAVDATACRGTLFEGACYELEERPATYSEALEQCQARGAHLVFLETEAEEQFVVSQLQEYGIGVEASGGTWLGARDLEVEDEFVWDDGSALTYQNFANTQPDDGEGVQCLELRLLLAGQPLWFDRPCSRLMPFTCERGL